MVFSGYNWISSTIRPASFLIHGTSDLPNRRFQSRSRKKKTLKGLLFFFLRSSKRTKNENGQKGQNELRDAFDEDGGRVGVVERHRLHVEAHALHVDVERLLGAPTRHGLFVVETKKNTQKKRAATAVKRWIKHRNQATRGCNFHRERVSIAKLQFRPIAIRETR